MIKIFHCADIHLDSPFSLCSPREAESRRTELRAAFTSAVMYAREAGADLFLISGDLFDSEYVTRDTKELLLREFRKSPDMRFFISPGNHDPFTPGSFYAVSDFPENVHVFGPPRECVHIDDLGVDVYGFAFNSPELLKSPVAGWGALDPERINILVCHGDMTSANSVTGPVTKADIGSSGFDYIALGHIHKGTGVLCENGVYYAYPGCLEGRGFDEQGVKGALYGGLEKGKAELKAVRFSRRRYESVIIDIGGITEKSAALEKIRREIKTFTDDTALRIALVGEQSESFVILPEEIGKGCEFPYYIEIIDKTHAAPDMGELEKSNTVKGVFFRNMSAKLAAAEKGSEEYRVLALAMKYGLAALEGRSVADYGQAEDLK